MTAERELRSAGPKRVPKVASPLLQLLEELTQVDSAGVTQLARRMGTPPPNVYRLLRLLKQTGYVEQLPDSKQYRLTLKLFELGTASANRITIRDIAAVDMERLAAQSGITVNLGTLTGAEVLYLEKIQTDDAVVVNRPTGSRAPAHCTAMGKAMLAFGTRKLSESLGPEPFPARTQHSLTTYRDLEAELAHVRSRGYAIDRQELIVGIWCAAAPIIGVRGDVLGALSVTAYRPYIDDGELERLGELVQMSARRVAARAGNWTGNTFGTSMSGR